MIIRRLRGGWVHLPAVDSGSEPLLLPFHFTGNVTVWKPIHRHLEIGPRAFGLAPRVR